MDGKQLCDKRDRKKERCQNGVDERKQNNSIKKNGIYS
jgi:hypothetical protein